MTQAVRDASVLPLSMAVLLALGSPPAHAQGAASTRLEAGGVPDDMAERRREMCQHLAARVAILQHRIIAPHAEADQLAIDGAHMCQIGLMGQGILHLRYALIELDAMQDSR